MAETFYFRNSSNVSSATYDKDAQTLEVQFTGGQTYRYSDVDPDTYRSFTLASSPGKFVHGRLSVFPYEPV